jgi:hypothetical protein
MMAEREDQKLQPEHAAVGCLADYADDHGRRGTDHAVEEAMDFGAFIGSEGVGEFRIAQLASQKGADVRAC